MEKAEQIIILNSSSKLGMIQKGFEDKICVIDRDRDGDSMFCEISL